MNTIFIGVAREMTDRREVYVERDGELRRLTRRAGGAQVGYSWDQAGPESIALGRAMLWLVTGVEPPFGLYRGFTSDIVASLPLPQKQGEAWRLSEADIRAWLRDVGWSSADLAGADRTSVLQRMRRAWDERVQRSAAIFRSRSTSVAKA